MGTELRYINCDTVWINFDTTRQRPLHILCFQYLNVNGAKFYDNTLSPHRDAFALVQEQSGIWISVELLSMERMIRLAGKVRWVLMTF